MALFFVRPGRICWEVKTSPCRISQYANLTLFVVRAGFTDKRLIEFSKNLNSSKKLYNMAYVLNDVGLGKSRDYNYGHGYGE